MQILGKNRINRLNRLGYALGLSNGGPWYCVAIYPGKGIVVDPTSGSRERVVVYGGRELNEYRTSITFAPIADALARYAGDFIAKVSFDGRFLSASVIKDGIKTCGKIYLATGIIWAEVLEQIEQAIYKAQANFRRLVATLNKMVQMSVPRASLRIVVVVVRRSLPGVLCVSTSLPVTA